MYKGLIIKTTGSWCLVESRGEVYRCRVKGKFRIKNITTTNPVAVGDKVEFELIEDGTGVIKKLEPRNNYVIRRSTRFQKEAHLLAANIDQACVMVCLKEPSTPREFIDRFLITAEAYHINSVLLINKIDLLNENEKEQLSEFVMTYSLAGYKCIEMSVWDNVNVEHFRELIQGKMNLLAGNSGVGKSTLINHINPGLNLKTEGISDYHKSGKHTTTFSEVFKVGDETYLIDSPGIRGFGLIDMEKAEIGLYFPEIFKYSKDCKYYNCTHLHEPGCAVIEAVREGKIGASRFNSYINIITEEESKYR
ncbi:MAG: ribosome small subunit-dependent GTPase A [Bacteroidales bacterium]|nr:ribosome small subunit-dependent GTPase A [Bacteroidales bacterium]